MYVNVCKLLEEDSETKIYKNTLSNITHFLT